AFDRDRVEVAIYSEVHSGPLLDERLLAWPDMLVLTGVTSSFDRMRHLTAYARTKAPGCVVVAGGPAIRNLPFLAAETFDYACQGDVEELGAVVAEVFGQDAAAQIPAPRYDLLTWSSPVNYAETSRYCNFRCSFCALTGERRSYVNYDLADVERQLRGYTRRKIVLFVDNNFFGSNRSAFLRKLDLLESLHREGVVPGWLALVTSDFFADSGNLERARRAGCLGLFCGVESFSRDRVAAYNKRQNLAGSQVDLIRVCLEAGIVFQYGLIFDPTTCELQEMERELDFVLGTSAVPLPAFLSLTIPLLGTPYFDETVASGRFLPLAKLRDMDGFTLLTRPRDGIEAVLPFVRQLARIEGRGRDVARHAIGFWRRYRRHLSSRQMGSLLMNSARLCRPGFVNGRRTGRHDADETLTYVTTTQPLGPLYRPAFPVAGCFEDHFSPTLVTDANGDLRSVIADNLAASRSSRQGAATRRQVSGYADTVGD
ncbi:MAG: radical SAM protein, partial [Methylobacteriaceae bacterium]|nr:radical SAM protein [Methylobacteriaceae bacterium]